MEVRLSPDLQATLDRLVVETGQAPEKLIEDAVVAYAAELTPARPTQDERGVGSPASVATQMSGLRARIKPDPDGWTTRDYVDYGRR